MGFNGRLARRSGNVGKRGEEGGKGMHATANKHDVVFQIGVVVRCGLHLLASQSCVWLCVSAIHSCDVSSSRHMRRERPSRHQWVWQTRTIARRGSARAPGVGDGGCVGPFDAFSLGGLPAWSLRLLSLSLCHSNIFSCVFISALLSRLAGVSIPTSVCPQ